MSHFVRTDKANITNKDSFIAACKELGLTEITKDTEIKDWAGKREKVDVAAKIDNLYSVGLQKNGSKWDMLCDWSMCYPSEAVSAKVGGSGRGNDLMNALIRTTTKHTIVNTYRRQGFAARVSVDAKMNIHVTLSR